MSKIVNDRKLAIRRIQRVVKILHKMDEQVYWELFKNNIKIYLELAKAVEVLKNLNKKP